MLGQDLDDNEVWFDAISDLPPDKPPSAFDEVGDYTKWVVVQSHDVLYSWDTSQHIVDACVIMHTYQAHAGNNCCISEHHNPDDTALEDQPPLYESHAHEVSKHPPDYQLLRPMFGWLPADLIKQTFKVTTSRSGTSHLSPLLMSILILSMWTHPLSTQEPLLPKFLLVWSLL